MNINGVDIEIMIDDLVKKHKESQRLLECFTEAVDELGDIDELSVKYFVELTESSKRIEDILNEVKDLTKDESIPVSRIASEMAMSSFVILSFNDMCAALTTRLCQAADHASKK